MAFVRYGFSRVLSINSSLKIVSHSIGNLASFYVYTFVAVLILPSLVVLLNFHWDGIGSCVALASIRNETFRRSLDCMCSIHL